MMHYHKLLEKRNNKKDFGVNFYIGFILLNLLHLFVLQCYFHIYLLQLDILWIDIIFNMKLMNWIISINKTYLVIFYHIAMIIVGYLPPILDYEL